MANKLNDSIIKKLLDYYFNNPKDKYLESEISDLKILIDYEIIVSEGDGKVSVNRFNTCFNKILLEFSEGKLKKRISFTSVNHVFKFIDDFEISIKKEYNARSANAYDFLINGLKIFVLKKLDECGIDLFVEILEINKSKIRRPNHLHSLERDLFNYIPFASYSESQIFDFCNSIEDQDYYLDTFFRNNPKFNLNLFNRLYKYAVENSINKRYIIQILIGLYNAGDSNIFLEILNCDVIDYNDKLLIVGRLYFHSLHDINLSFDLVGLPECDDLDKINHQAYFLRRVLENSFANDTIKDKSFKFYNVLLNNNSKENCKHIITNIYFIQGYDLEKYTLLLEYLALTGDYKVIEDFFTYYQDPKYVFKLMMRLFASTPNYRFPVKLFENGIQNALSSDIDTTKDCILNLFKQDPVFGLLGVKVILIDLIEVIQIDFLKLNKAQFQINAIDCICKHPESFNKLLLLILPLRNSKLEGVKEHLQSRLAEKVFYSYQDVIYSDIINNMDESNEDIQFLKPINTAFEEYTKLKELKESINDLNPFENEKDLMNLYYRLEHEENAKMMEEVSSGKGTFMEMAKSVNIVRGNSWMIREGEVSPLGKFEYSMQIDTESFLNPDLYEHNLNKTK